MPTRTVKYQVNSLRSCIRSSLEYMRLVIGKKTMLWWKLNCLLPNAHTWWGLWGFHARIIPNLHPPTTRYKMASHSWTLQSLAFSLRTWIQVQKFKKSHYPIPPNSISLHSFYTFPRSPNLHKAFRLGVEEGGTTQNADSQSDRAKKNGSKMVILKQFGVTRKLKWQNNIAHQILSSSLFSVPKKMFKKHTHNK